MRTVAVCGRSLALSCVEASLRKRPGIRVVSTDEIDVGQPEVVIFELATCQFDSVKSIWKKQPQVRLIGLGFLEEEALVISSHAVRISTLEDLVQVIEGQVNGL